MSVSAAAKDCVVILHGLAKSDKTMSEIASKLSANNFKSVNVDYPSTKFPIQQLAAMAIEPALKQCEPLKEMSNIHFVTHSMGGILVRQYLSDHDISNLGRVVMLGPPNNGSEVVDKYSKFPGFDLITGPAGLQLGTGQMSVPKKLGAVDFDSGVIAGSSSLNLILSTMLPNQDDGKVSVESTKVEGMQDHIIMPVTHVFMMKNNKVIEQVIYFLNHGEFKRNFHFRVAP
nr:alpha/beta hydrolase [Parashewanella hymeniacidonis]